MAKKTKKEITKITEESTIFISIMINNTDIEESNIGECLELIPRATLAEAIEDAKQNLLNEDSGSEYEPIIYECKPVSKISLVPQVIFISKKTT